MSEPTIFELSSPGRQGVRFPDADVPETALPEQFKRKELPLPEMAELDVVRHFTHISQFNYAVDIGYYPLGSCTMKYNPKANEAGARLPGFAFTHPLQPIETIQGNLGLMYGLQEWLKEIGGFAGISMQAAAGAQGEMVGVKVIAAYHKDNGEPQRTKMLIPDSAHGTNPASSAMSGFEIVKIPTDCDGNVDMEAVKAQADDTLAGMMITNPNTLGLFEQQVVEVIKIIHDAGGLVYGDGANMNALLGIVRPGDLGIDVMHYNLHKTFSTPHGGGGPGSGPVGVSEKLVDFLPGPIATMVEEGTEDEAPYYDLTTPKKSIGRVKSFVGQFGMFVRAYNYISMLGAKGLREAGEYAVLNANYLRALVKDTYHIPYDRICMHEFVAEGRWKDAPNVSALDVAKRLIDYGFHPPTNYFPLIVHEALMIEPTETESMQTLDKFAAAMLKIAEEAHASPDLLTSAPHTTPVGRLDEVKAAKELVLKDRSLEK